MTQYSHFSLIARTKKLFLMTFCDTTAGIGNIAMELSNLYFLIFIVKCGSAGRKRCEFFQSKLAKICSTLCQGKIPKEISSVKVI